VADPQARDRVLDAATWLFYERGTRGVGMNEVITVAGCGKNLAYSHFPSKDDLVAEYLQRFLDAREQAAVAAAAAAGPDPKRQIIAILTEAAEQILSPRFRGCAARNYVVESRGAPDRGTEIARAYLRRARRALRKRVAATGVAEPERVADRIWIVMEGLYSMGVHLGPRRDLVTEGLSLVEELLR